MRIQEEASTAAMTHAVVKDNTLFNPDMERERRQQTLIISTPFRSDAAS